MIYSDLYLKKEGRHYYFIIFFSFIILMFTFSVRFFLKNSIPSRASKKNIRRIEVVNLSYDKAGIYWLSEQKEKGWVVFGENKNKLNNIVFDDRDTTNLKDAYINHYVVLKDLEPNKNYFFKIISNNQIIDNGGEPFHFKTTTKQEFTTRFSPVYGRIIKTNGEPLSAGVVILNFTDSYPLLSLVKISGEWMIPLNNIIERSTEKIKTEIKDQIVNLEIYDENGNKSNVKTKGEMLSQIPQPIIIGKNYEFFEEEKVLGVINKNNKENIIDIIYPKQNSIISSARPLIKGLALPNNDVYLNLRSKKNIYSFRTKADRSGNWKVLLNNNLLPDSYILEMKTKNQEKKEVVLNREFQIIKSGERVLSEATLSASLTPSIGITISPTLKPTTLPTTTPIISPTIKSVGFNPTSFVIAAISFIIIGVGFLFVF